MSSYYKHFGYVQAFLSKGKKAKSWRLLKDNKCMCKNTYLIHKLGSWSSTTKYYTMIYFTQQANFGRFCGLKPKLVEFRHFISPTDYIDKKVFVADKRHSDWPLG